MSGGHSPVRYTGREKQPGDNVDNLAGPKYVTLEENITLACSNLAQYGVGDRNLRRWISESRDTSEWARKVLAALDGLGPDAIWQDRWGALMQIRQAITNERTGYDPS